MKIGWRQKSKHPDIAKDVEDFHHRFQFPDPRYPRWPDKGVVGVRLKLIREETDELIAAIESPNRSFVKVAREAIDVVYVAIGVFVDFGLPFVPCWKAVHSANMSKKACPDGGKPSKPNTWAPPDEIISEAIGPRKP